MDGIVIETLILPGLNGSPEGHWQHYWTEDDPHAEMVEQEDWSQPRLVDWLHNLEARLAAGRPGVILVAHSLGCSLVAALSGRPSASHVGGALLVAPADPDALTDRHPTTSEFGRGHGTPLPFASVLVASRDDPFMTFAAAERQASTWGSAFFDLGNAGHVNIASGFGRWGDGLVLADGMRKGSAGVRAADRAGIRHEEFHLPPLPQRSPSPLRTQPPAIEAERRGPD